MLTPAELDIARGLPPLGCSVAEAERYTRTLATRHYENFTVVSWLLLRRLRRHFYNVYAYCRWADDLGDEVADPQRALALLNEWEAELRACYAGRPQHAVFVALRGTVAEFDIPIAPFADLLVAFRQDQTVHRYVTWDALLGYCRYSANPVGRLVLYLCGYRDAERQRLSDATCTALQLANFWQDVRRDLDKGRIYIPLETLAAHGLNEADIVARHFDARYVALMKDLIARTRELFAEGRPLGTMVAPELRVDLELFSRGGEAVLEAIERLGYNTLAHRPALSRTTQARLFSRALASRLLTALGGDASQVRAQHAAPLQQNSPDVGAGLAPPASADQSGKTTSAGDPQIASSYAYCAQIARSSRSNFYFAFFLLPRAKREAFSALYAFMRRVDDMSDQPGDTAAKRQRLRACAAALDRAVADDCGDDPILPALADTLCRFAIPPRYLHELIAGAEMDLAGTPYATFDDLRLYCYRVAGTVGLCCVHVFGFTDPRAPELAEKLGLAFQLTNILRDLRADYESGRVYLPREEFERFSLDRSVLSQRQVTPELRALLAFEAERAWRFYEEGAALLPLVQQDSRGALWALVRIYSRLLERIEARGFEVLSGAPVRVPRLEKLWILARAWAGAGQRGNLFAERDRHRRRAGGTVVGRRAG